MTRYAVVGLGARSLMYTSALMDEHRAAGELVGLCDVNATRMDWYNRLFAERYGAAPIPSYGTRDFTRMLRERAVEAVIVTSVDRTHHEYIVGALEYGCDVITEKPLTIDAERAQTVVDAVAQSGRRVTVAFNYRYAPRNQRVKELLEQRSVGDVLSVHFEWLLDTRHGADYFRRWHRDKSNSGGLMVHKASHHFDLVNWWLGARPVSVFGFGRLGFYGRVNAHGRGVTEFYERAHGSAAARDDPFALDLEADPALKGLYLDAEAEDGYLRDRSVFADGITIEDDMAVVVRYDTEATMSYHLHAYAPWEGYRVAFNCTGGRLELDVVERAYAAPSEFGPASVRLTLRPHWEPPREVELEDASADHSEADHRLVADLFGPRAQLPTHVDGVWAILPSIGANQCFATGHPVDLTTLVRF